MKTAEMRKKTATQLEQHAEKLAKELAEYRLSMITNSEKNVRKARQIRKERAQALTVAAELRNSESEEK